MLAELFAHYCVTSHIVQGTEPVVLNRTVGYDGGSLQQSEHEPHGVIKTDITYVLSIY